MGREDLRAIALIGFTGVAALGVWILVEGLRYTDPDYGDPLSNIITLLGIALTVLAVCGALTVHLAFRGGKG